MALPDGVSSKASFSKAGLIALRQKRSSGGVDLCASQKEERGPLFLSLLAARPRSQGIAIYRLGNRKRRVFGRP